MRINQASLNLKTNFRTWYVLVLLHAHLGMYYIRYPSFSTTALADAALVVTNLGHDRFAFHLMTPCASGWDCGS